MWHSRRMSLNGRCQSDPSRLSRARSAAPPRQATPAITRPPPATHQPPPNRSLSLTGAPQAPPNTILRDPFEGPGGRLERMDSDLRDLPRSRPPDTSATANSPGRDRPAAALISVGLGFFVIQLDVTIVNVALPAIQREIGGSLAGLQWVVDAYTMALAAIMLTAGSTADRVGARKIFTLGLAAFALGSAACAVALA